MKKTYRIVALVCVCILLFGLTACGSSADKAYYDYEASSSTAAYAPAAAYDVAEESFSTTGKYNSSSAETVQDTTRKLIKTASLDVETKEFEKCVAGIESQITALGGYMESSNTYNGSEYDYGGRTRNASITARIPANNLEQFIGAVSEHGNVVSKSSSVQDITLSYVDTESRNKMLRTEQERLLAYLETAESMEDIISIESRLSEIRYEIESVESRLRTFDNQVDYSTVYLSINEVETYTPPKEETAWERMSQGFVDSVLDVVDFLKEFCIGFVIAVPKLVMIAVLVIAAIFMIKGIKKKKSKKLEAKNEKKETTADGQESI